MAAGATISRYTDGVCTAPAAASGTAADFRAAGLAVTVADNATTTGHATATDPMLSQIA